MHCNLKAQSSLLDYQDNYYLGASAILLTGVPPPVIGTFEARDGALAPDDDDFARDGSTQEGGIGASIGGHLPDDDPRTWRVVNRPYVGF